MPDIAQKLFSTRPSYNGSAVVLSDKNGGSQILRPYFSTSQNTPNASGMVLKLDNRFDDPTYYTA